MFTRLGFQTWNNGGQSRSWRRFLEDGSYLLVTDAGGYDLPEQGGPYIAVLLSAHDELIEASPVVWRPRDVVRWVRHAERFVKKHAQGEIVNRDVSPEPEP